MIRVSQLGYLGINASAIESVAAILSGVCGLEVTRIGDQLHARMDERHHRITVHAHSEPSLAYLGFEVATRSALELAEKELEELGFIVMRGSATDCTERAVMEFIHFSGPDDVRIELYCNATVLSNPLRPGRPIQGFVAGERGLGHVVLVSADPTATERFYTQVLGFGVSDYIHFDGLEITFMHCNRRHHSVAVLNEFEGMRGGQLNHVMFEMQALDDVGRGYDIARQLKVPLVMELGRHTNDKAVSFYMASDGFAVEYGYGGREIGDDWQVVRYEAAHIWGHHGTRSAHVG
jgi:2,3-dihydroxybiphenyl 1,2-dioxygenase